jgi:hypothetical protein
MDINAKTNFEKASAKYHALIQECNAEVVNLESFNAEREHMYQMRKADAYATLGHNNSTKIVMSGTSGQNLINKIFDL